MFRALSREIMGPDVRIFEIMGPDVRIFRINSMLAYGILRICPTSGPAIPARAPYMGFGVPVLAQFVFR